MSRPAKNAAFCTVKMAIKALRERIGASRLKMEWHQKMGLVCFAILEKKSKYALGLKKLNP